MYLFVFPQLVGVTWWTKHKPATEKEERSNKDDVEMTENLNKLANEENQGTDVIANKVGSFNHMEKYLPNIILYRKTMSMLILEAQKPTIFKSN